MGDFEKYVPKRIIQIRPSDYSWCNRYTRLLMRKNCNYHFLKRAKTTLRNIKTKKKKSNSYLFDE